MKPALAIALLVSLTAIGAYFSCRSQSREPEATSPSSVTSLSRARPNTRMMKHENAARAMRDAITAADLAATKRAARELGKLQAMSGATPELQERLDAMRAATAVFADLEDSSRTARAFGDVAKACSDCHAQHRGPTRVEVEPPPPSASGARPRMLRHEWATANLWDGLVLNSEAPWRAGAAVLSDPALRAEELAPRDAPIAEIDVLAKSVEEIGRSAAAATDNGVRAELFGDLLASCASCHEKLGSRRRR